MVSVAGDIGRVGGRGKVRLVMYGVSISQLSAIQLGTKSLLCKGTWQEMFKCKVKWGG